MDLPIKLIECELQPVNGTKLAFFLRGLDHNALLVIL